MSAENVEIAKRVIDAFNRRDVEGFFALAVPDFEWFPAMAGTAKGGGYRGRDGIEKYLVDIGEAWEEYRVSAQEFRDLDERVVMLGRIEGRGRGSRAWIESPTGTIFEFLGGKMSRLRTQLDHGEALRTAGLAKQAMSANLDLVRSIFADWERGDFSAVEWADPEIKFVIGDGPLPGTWKGTDGMAEGFREWLSAWEDVRIESDEYRELDNERVLVLVCSSGRGKASGLDLAQMGGRGAAVFHVRDGKMTRLVLYADCDRAFADLGLKGQAMSQERS